MEEIAEDASVSMEKQGGRDPGSDSPRRSMALFPSYFFVVKQQRVPVLPA